MSDAASRILFDRMPDGAPVEKLILRGGGLTLGLIAFGASVQDLRLEGIAHPLVLGGEGIAAYLGPMAQFGALAGRFANRIGQGRFTLDEAEHQTDRNWKGHTLHGGEAGTSRLLWTIAEASESAALLTLDLPDGHMGFPGALSLRARFSLPGDGALRIEITGTADAPTPCSIAHHSYFTLDDAGSALPHALQVHADARLEVDADLIPTGVLLPVEGTRFDHRELRPIATPGLDHCYALRGDGMREAAVLRGTTGVTMRVRTDAPGLQVYDGGGVDAAHGLGGRSYGPHAGIAMETQSFPDAPNRPEFPSAILRPGEVYRHRVEYIFSR